MPTGWPTDPGRPKDPQQPPHEHHTAAEKG